jgi:hypothetical protein
MALMAAHGEITPMPVAAIFADTQSEPQAVYDWLDVIDKHLPFPVLRVTRGSLRKHVTTPYWSNQNQKMTVAVLPAFVLNPDGTQGLMSRQCTRDYKINPINKTITRLMRENGVKRCVMWIGISLDEWPRMKPSRRSTVTHRWPLFEKRLNRHACLLWLKRNGYPQPSRSACTFCPYRSDAEWRRLTPNEFADAVQFEKELQAAHTATPEMRGKPFLHRSMVPLGEVDLSTEEERGQSSLFGNDCEGMCGV